MEPKNLTEREMQELTYLKDIRNEDTLRYSVLSNKWNSETSISLKEPYDSLDKTQTYSVKRMSSALNSQEDSSIAQRKWG